MNTVLKGALYLVGGVSLFTGSFVGVAMVTGRSAHEIPLLKNFADKPQSPSGGHTTQPAFGSQTWSGPHATGSLY